MTENKKQLVQFLVGNKQKVSEAVVTKSVTLKTEGKEQQTIKTETLNAPVLSEAEPTKLWIEYGITKNLGNYESAKISIGLSIPVGAEKTPLFAERVHETKSRASFIIENLIGHELDELTKILSDRSEKSANNPF